MAQTQNEHLRCVEELYTETASLTGMAPESLALDDVPHWNDVQRMLASGLATGPRQGMFTVNPGTPQRTTRESSQKRTRMERRVPEEQDADEDIEAAEQLMFMTMKREPTPEERPPPVSGNEPTALGKRHCWPPHHAVKPSSTRSVATTHNFDVHAAGNT